MSTNNYISLLLVDDHALMRQMLEEKLAAESDIVVLGAVENADRGVDEAIRLKPDVVLMDIDMPGLVCFDGVRLINQQCPGTRVIFLSAFSHDHYIEQALAVEAAGYVTKSETPEVVMQAIRSVSRGRNFYSETIRNRIVVDTGGTRLVGKKKSRVATLTPRELEVLRYVARGLTEKEIANTMRLSPKTVHCHTANLMNKLSIHKSIELARFAIREGLAEA